MLDVYAAAYATPTVTTPPSFIDGRHNTADTIRDAAADALIAA